MPAVATSPPAPSGRPCATAPARRRCRRRAARRSGSSRCRTRNRRRRCRLLPDVEDRIDVAGAQAGVGLPHQRDRAGDDRAGEAGAAGGEELVRAAGRSSGRRRPARAGRGCRARAVNSVITSNWSTDPTEAPTGRPPGTRCRTARRADAAVAAGGGDEHAALPEQRQLVAVARGALPAIVPSPKEMLAATMLNSALVVEHPAQRVLDALVGHGVVGRVDAQREQVRAGGDALVARCRRARTRSAPMTPATAVPWPKVSIGSASSSTKSHPPTTLCPGPKPLPERRVRVVDAGIDDGDGRAGAGDAGEVGGGPVLADEPGDAAPRASAQRHGVASSDSIRAAAGRSGRDLEDEYDIRCLKAVTLRRRTPFSSARYKTTG